MLVIFISFRVTMACGELQKSDTVDETLPGLPKTFSGMLPCADCPGILYYVQLKDDSFTEISWYQDRDPGFFEESGMWSIKGDTLFTYSDTDIDSDDPYKIFLYRDDQLTLLDENRQQVTGELARHYQLEQNHSEESIRTRYSEFEEEGIDFIASGNEPFWSVRVDNETSLTFRTPVDSLLTSAPELQEKQNGVVFTATSGSDIIMLTAEKTYCIDSMSGFLFTHTVTLEIPGRDSLSGCGMFLDEL